MTDKDIRFLSVVTMFAEMAMQQLGKQANPVSGKVEKNLEGAKMTIDLLMMLKEKTKGNLSPDEEGYLKNILSNCQMNYVDEKNAPAEAPEEEKPEEKTEDKEKK